MNYEPTFTRRYEYRRLTNTAGITKPIKTPLKEHLMGWAVGLTIIFIGCVIPSLLGLN